VTTYSERVSPHSLDAEMVVLGAAMVDREVYAEIDGLLHSHDFYSGIHGIVFSAIARLYAAGKPLDKIAVANELRTTGTLEKCGGLTYLTSMLDILPTSASMRYYAGIVREKAQLRALISAASQLQEIGFSGETDVASAMARAEKLVRDVVDGDYTHSRSTPMSTALARNAADVGAARSGLGKVAQRTPWDELDRHIGGFYGGNLVVWAAAPKAGKTGLVVNVADWIATHYGSVGMFALEMGESAITRRFLALRSGISSRRQMDGDLTDLENDKLVAARQSIMSMPLHILESRSMSVSDLRREVRLLDREYGLASVVVDHVNFLANVDPGAGSSHSTKHERLDYVYRELLRIAQDHDIVVHAVQHVNRTGMQGPPTLDKIRDGGNPEGHAHAVIFPYRPNPIGTMEERREGQLIIAAAREGDAGAVDMVFHGYRGLWQLREDFARSGERAWFDVPEPKQRSFQREPDEELEYAF